MFVEYAKEGPEDILVRITVHNRGPEAARLRVLPTLWFRNTWSWGGISRSLRCAKCAPGVIAGRHITSLANTGCTCDGAPELLFTENETNAGRLWGQPNASPYVKDAFHACIVSGRSEAVNPAKVGTKAAAHYRARRAGRRKPDRPAPSDDRGRSAMLAFVGFEDIFDRRIADADEFYDRISPKSLTEDERRVHRQALAGHAVEQAVLLLRCRSVAQAAQESSAAGRARPPRAQYANGFTC